MTLPDGFWTCAFFAACPKARKKVDPWRGVLFFPIYIYGIDTTFGPDEFYLLAESGVLDWQDVGFFDIS